MVLLFFAAAIVACAPGNGLVELRFTLADPDGVHRLQFYVHDVVLLDGQGGGVPVIMSARAPWQSERVALLDFSANEGRTVIEAQAPAGAYTGVRFAVGVPFELNHANPLTAAAPLNRGELFWTWQSGYKFFRLDLATAPAHPAAAEHEAGSGQAFHLGSTGCSSASALRPPTLACAQPNVIHVELRGFDPLTQPIVVRVADVVAALNEPGARACTGDYAQPLCARALATTGLDAQSGTCTDEAGICRRQRLFLH